MPHSDGPDAHTLTTAIQPVASLRGRNFLSTGDLSQAELLALLELALAAKQAGPRAFGRPLDSRGVGLVFFNPSLRTRASMTMAVAQLGGQPVPLDIGAGTWDLEHRIGVIMDGNKSEHIREAVPVLSQYVDAIGVRCFPAMHDLAEDRRDPVLRAFADNATVPIINLESSMYHPCQALADMLTIRERLGRLGGQRVSLVWANHPKALPLAVPQSFALAALQCGLDLTIAAPPEYHFDTEGQRLLTEAAAANGGKLRLTTDQRDAYAGSQVIYAKSWASPMFYGHIEQDLACRSAHRDWQVTPDKMALGDDAVFMHCLPVRRNVVVADAVLDGPRSVVVQQAGNRLHAQKALLASLLAPGAPSGA